MGEGGPVLSTSLFVTIFGLLASAALLLLWIGLKGGGAAIGVIAFAAALLATTPVAQRLTQRRSDGAFTAVNSTLLLAIIICFGAAILRPSVPLSWIIFAVAFVLLIQLSAFGFRRCYQSVLSRLHDSGALHGASSAFSFEAWFGVRSYLYLTLPAGSVIGATISTALDLDARGTLRICAISILGLLVLCVGIVLALDAIRLADAQLVEQPGGDQSVQPVFLIDVFKLDQRVRSALARRAHVGASRPGSFRVVIEPVDLSSPSSVEQALNGVVLAADIRQLLLVHQYALLPILAMPCFALLQLSGVTVNFAASAIASLAVILALTQIPYVVGQKRAHDVVLARGVGVPREEIRERLLKLSPAIPQFQMWLMMLASGGAGGILASLFSELINRLVLPQP